MLVLTVYILQKGQGSQASIHLNDLLLVVFTGMAGSSIVSDGGNHTEEDLVIRNSLPFPVAGKIQVLSFIVCSW